MAAKPLFLISFLFSACAFAQTPQFTIQDLGTLPNLPSCTATALSQSGNVTGYCNNAGVASLLNNPTTRAFLYSNGKLTDLNLTAQSTPVPTAVNDSGIVAGAYTNVNVLAPSVSATPFVVLQNGSVTMPSGPMQGVLPGGLNNAGQLVGSFIQIGSGVFNFFLNTRAVVYTVSSGTSTTLTAPAGSGAGAAFGINSLGTVVGAGVGQNGTAVAPVIWPSGQPAKALSFLTGFPQAGATSVNDSGVAAGVAFNINFNVFSDPNATAHAILFNADGSATDLGVLPGDLSSLATSINNSGTVVGFSNAGRPDFTLQLTPAFEAPKPSDRAFIYAAGKMYDLTTLLTNGTGWKLSFASGINNAGQITGTGIFNNQQHAFLLTPAAAPTGPAITGVGGAGGSVPAVTSLSANGLFTIYGSNFTTTPAGINSGNILNNELPTNLGGVCVESNGTKWGLFFVSAGQINALAGTLPASGTVPVTVVTNCGTGTEVSSPVMNVPVAPVAPEFLYFVAHADGANPIAAADFTTGTLAGAAGLIPGATFAPVHANDVVIAYGVGWGTTSSTDPIGTLATDAASLPAGSYSLTVGGMPANVSYAGLSPGSAGLYQMNFTVPSGLSAGDQKVVLKIGTASTSPNAFITVGN
jgi:uncharacterized protein (TIGR03437 family)